MIKFTQNCSQKCEIKSKWHRNPLLRLYISHDTSLIKINKMKKYFATLRMLNSVHPTKFDAVPIIIHCW